jgi:hypothetical protein
VRTAHHRHPWCQRVGGSKVRKYWCEARRREIPLPDRRDWGSLRPKRWLLDVDFAINWRADPPVTLRVWAVLSERDAVAGKLSAVYSRGEVRDFLDLDAIRSSGRYSDADIIALGHEHDDGFDEGMFAAQLSRVANYLPSEAFEYDVTPEAFQGVQQRILSWAVALDKSALDTRDRPARTPPASRPNRPKRNSGGQFSTSHNRPDPSPPPPSL